MTLLRSLNPLSPPPHINTSFTSSLRALSTKHQVLRRDGGGSIDDGIWGTHSGVSTNNQARTDSGDDGGNTYWRGITTIDLGGSDDGAILE